MEAAFLSSFIYEFKSSRKQLQAIFGSGLETNLTFKMLLASSPVRFLKYFVWYFSFIFHQQSRYLLCAHQRIGIGFNELYTWDIQPRSSPFCVAGTNSSVCHSHSLMLFIYSFIYIPSLPPKRVFTPGLLNICVKKKKPCITMHAVYYGNHRNHNFQNVHMWQNRCCHNVYAWKYRSYDFPNIYICRKMSCMELLSWEQCSTFFCWSRKVVVPVTTRNLNVHINKHANVWNSP